ncbi:hypothetical protein MBLNU230_g1229t1 [Neophaeotheca triangularis]
MIDFPHLKAQLMDLQDYAVGQRPQNFREVWNDHRDPEKALTFRAVVVFGSALSVAPLTPFESSNPTPDSTITYSNDFTAFLTQTNSLGVVTGQPVPEITTPTSSSISTPTADLEPQATFISILEPVPVPDITTTSTSSTTSSSTYDSTTTVIVTINVNTRSDTRGQLASATATRTNTESASAPTFIPNTATSPTSTSNSQPTETAISETASTTSDAAVSASAPSQESTDDETDGRRDEDSDDNGGMSEATRVGLGVGIGVGVACLLLGIGLGFFLRRRRTRGARSPAPLEVQGGMGYNDGDAKPELDGSGAWFYGDGMSKGHRPSELLAEHGLHELTAGEVRRYELPAQDGREGR